MKSHDICMFFGNFCRNFHQNYHDHYHIYQWNHHYHHWYFLLLNAQNVRGGGVSLIWAMPKNKRLFSKDLFAKSKLNLWDKQELQPAPKNLLLRSDLKQCHKKWYHSHFQWKFHGISLKSFTKQARVLQQNSVCLGSKLALEVLH